MSTLLLQGLSKRAIAEQLVISHRTVECHIGQALAKTGCVTRLELALRMSTMTSTPA